MTIFPPAKRKSQYLAHWIALGGGAGLSPRAPGTLGTLVAVPLAWLLLPLEPILYSAVVVGLFAIGVWACGTTARSYGVPDHGAIVWDEIVGYLIAVAYLPATWPWLLGAFALFRLFDIWKPWPIRWVDRTLHGGWGIMLDDALAGVFTLGLLHLVAASVTAPS